MISALTWIPRGAAQLVPAAAAYTEEELAVAKEAAEGLSEEDWAESPEEGSDSQDSDDDGAGSEGVLEEEVQEGRDLKSQIAKAKAAAAAVKVTSQPAADALDVAMAELDMDSYDADGGDGEGGASGVFGNANPGLAYYANNDADPYIRLAAVPNADSDAEDSALRGDDLLLLVARNEDDVSHLEIWVFEEADEAGGPPNMYVHHDVLLPAFPLSLAWLDCPAGGTAGGSRGNLAAVGTMSPGIEVWDLDVLETVEPVALLGGELAAAATDAGGADGSGAGEKKRKKSMNKKKAKRLKEGSHGDSVLGLSWNREYRNVLASASADHTVKVWDVATQSCQATLDWHTDKVQAVAWNPADAPVLLSGGFDRRAFLGDARSPSSALRWDVSADVEALAWDPHSPTRFLVSTEDGCVAAYDARSGAGAAPLFRLQAHDKPACCLCFNPAAKDLLATASTDKKVKLWDVAGPPSLVAAQDVGVGAVFAAGFCGDQPSLLAAGGAEGEVVVWDVLSAPSVAARYAKSFAAARRLGQ